jgi:hypothetical protein
LGPAHRGNKKKTQHEQPVANQGIVPFVTFHCYLNSSESEGFNQIPLK